MRLVSFNNRFTTTLQPNNETDVTLQLLNLFDFKSKLFFEREQNTMPEEVGITQMQHDVVYGHL